MSTPHHRTDCLAGNILILLLIGCGFLPVWVRGATYRSPEHLVVSPDGQHLYVTETTAGTVAEISKATMKIIRRYPTESEPTGLTLSRDGKRLIVTTGMAPGRIRVFSTENGKKLAAWEVGHSPTSPVVSPKGDQFYVSDRFRNRVIVIDADTGKPLAEIPVRREPVSAVLTQDGANLLVSNHLPAGASDASYVASVVTVIDTRANRVSYELILPNGSNGLRDIRLSPDGQFAYVGHVLARYQVPATQLERGWINTNAVTVIDVKGMRILSTFLLDDLDQGAPNPWGIAVSEDGRLLVVTHAGNHEVSLIDRQALHQKLSANSPDEIVNDLNFAAGIRQRVPLPGLSPRGCVFHGNLLYVAQFFSDDIGVVDLSNPSFPSVSSLPLGKKHPMDEIRRGRFLFNDASYCFQQWQSCTSCHPSERMDGLNWDLLNDGIGNPKNTKSLLFSHATPPTTFTGCRPNAETSVRAGIRFMMASLPESDARAMDAFLKSMEPLPSPYLENGGLSASAERGKQVFAKAQCGQCHNGPYHTDLQQYDVGTGEGYEFDTAFDVPSLNETWRTAPYLYDGRAETLRDVLIRENPEDRHGKVRHLTEGEVADLIAYVLSL